MKITCHLWALVFVIVKASGCYSTTSPGNLLPRDSNYIVGSNVSLNCILNITTMISDNKQYDFNSSLLTFKFGNKALKSEVILINETEAMTVIRNGQPKDSGRYYCYLKLPDRNVLVCPSDIRFGHSPENVTNFKCRSYYLRNLTCTWSAPNNSAPVKYSLSYKLNQNEFPFSCPNPLNATSCGWTRDGPGAIYMPIADDLTFFLNGYNGIGKNSTEVFHFHHWSIVIPDEPRDMKVTKSSATQISLEWVNPQGMSPSTFLPGLCYRVLYKAPYQHYFTSRDTGTNESSMTLSGLTPNRWYTIKVKARSCAADADLEEDLWSSFNSINTQTKSDIPWTSPQAHESFFDVVNGNFSRNVTVYWKHLGSLEENGGDFHYEVSIVETFLNRKRRDTEEVKRFPVYKDNFKTFSHLDMESAYLVRIWSVNSEGPSPNFTRIVIPKYSRMLPRPLHVRPVSEGGGKYQVSWQPSSKTVQSYVLVWCQGSQRCKFDLNWKTVDANTSSVILPLEDNKNYGFGLTAISYEEGLSSGLEWAPCPAYRNRVLDRVTGLRAVPTQSRSISISWKLACEAQKAIVTRYEVSICKNGCRSCTKECQPCTEKKTQVLTDPEIDSMEFKNLRPYTAYQYSVIAFSDRGGSPESFWRCASTLQDAPSDPPHSVKYSNVTNSSIQLSWTPPVNPNGAIDRYVVHYKEISGRSYQQPDRMSQSIPVDPKDPGPKYEYELPRLKCFTNYSVMISACVHLQCSNDSSPLYVKTEIGVPGTMDPPRTEVVNSSHVRVIWKAPEQPNGPVNCYLLHLFKREINNITRLDLINVTGTSVELPRDCSPEVHTSGEGVHLFSVQALNLVPGQDYLYGPISNATETKLCLMGPEFDTVLVTGIIIGSTLALAIVILALYFVVRWMKMKVDKMKNIDVILPDGLQQPYSHSYENFKKGLSSEASEPNLSPKLGYGRMDSYTSDSNSDDSFKNRHGSGTSHFSASSNDELINKSTQGGQVTAPRSFSGTGEKNGNRGERKPSGDNSSGHDSVSSSMTHHTNLSTDGSSCSEGPRAKGREPHIGQDYRLDEESEPKNVFLSGGSSLPNSNNFPTTPYSKLGFAEGGRLGDYLPLARGRHLSLYGHNLANSEPSITDLSPDPYTFEPNFQQDPPSPDVPYSKFGMSHSVTDLILEGMELPESPLSPNPSPHEALPYSRFGLRRAPPPNQANPYVTMGMALVVGPQRNPNQLLASKVGAPPFILKSPLKKNTVLEQPSETINPSDEAYSKLGLGSVVEQEGQAKFQPYLTMKEVKENEQNQSLPDLTISSREESPTHHVPDKVRCKEPSESAYLPHQLIPAVSKAAEPALPDLVNCTNILPMPADSQELPGVKVQEGSGYVSLNQVLSSNLNV